MKVLVNATWTSGLLPGITKYAGGGANDRASDASVAHDARHNVWLISSLTLLESGGVHGNAVVTSRSTYGGTTWGNPVLTASGGDLDSNWIACDNTATSPFYGHCFTEWDDHGGGNRMQMSTSTDGGQHWTAPATNNNGIIGGQPVVQPNGTVVVPTANTSSTNGTTWSAVTRVPIDVTTTSGIDHFIPGLAVTGGASGSAVKLGLTYYLHPFGRHKAQRGLRLVDERRYHVERADDRR